MPDATHPVVALMLFGAGIALLVWAVDFFLKGLVGVAALLGTSTFAITVVLSGLEAENVAVGVASGAEGVDSLALGTVFGGAVFLVCVALGLAAVVFPLRVDLPRPVLLVFLGAPIVAGIGVASPMLQRPIGLVLLAAFVLGMAGLLLFSRSHTFFESEALEEVEKERPSNLRSITFTIVGLLGMIVGGEMVAKGGEALIGTLPLPPLLLGMVIAPAAIEFEEVFRQAVPTRAGHPEVAAGNAVGTMLYFVLFNFGLIALLTPLPVQPIVASFDWLFLVGVTALAALFLWRGGINRWQGGILLAGYGAFAVGHVILG
jgi:cation:H+ antiporter